MRKSLGPSVQKVCPICSKTYKVPPCRLAIGEGGFCSRACYHTDRVQKGNYLRPHVDLTGKTFHRVFIVRYLLPKERRKIDTPWLCRCECGTEFQSKSDALTSGRTKSCGCLSKERTSARMKTHGLSKISEYSVWEGIKDRCLNPNGTGYSDYGGRGIEIDPRWLEFANFYEDMGTRPSPKHTIERKDNNGPYSKENCVWALQAQQARNKRTNVNITYNGKTQCLRDWSRETGISEQLLGKRVKAGWPIKDLFLPPLRRPKSQTA